MGKAFWMPKVGTGWLEHGAPWGRGGRCYSQMLGRDMEPGKHATHQPRFTEEGYFADFTCCSQLFFEYLSKTLAGQFSFALYISILRKLSFVSAPDPSLEKDRGKSGCGPACLRGCLS